MTYSQIRRQVDALMRKYRRELAIYRTRRVASEISDQWMIATANQQPKPEPSDCVQKFVSAGLRLKTFMSLRNYIQRCIKDERFPEVRAMLTTLLPWTIKGRWLNRLEWSMPGSA